MFAHSRAATAAAARNTAPPVSAYRKPRIGAARFRAQAVRPATGAVIVVSAAAINGAGYDPRAANGARGLRRGRLAARAARTAVALHRVPMPAGERHELRER